MRLPNPKCRECALLDIRNMPEKPRCYDIKVCARRRSYYRDHERKKIQMRARFYKYQTMSNECALCASQHQLEVHHVEPRQGKPNRDELSNMMTLCRSCHKLIESYTAKVRSFYRLQESLATGVNFSALSLPVREACDLTGK